MIEQGKISTLQMNVILFPTILATAVLSVPSITMAFAGHDMWLSPLLASPVGLLAIAIAYRLNKRYPHLSPIESSVLILGRLPGKLFGLFFLLYFPHLNGIVLREYGEFILSAILPGTPLFVVMGSLMFVCALNVVSGIEVLGRTGIILVTLMATLLILILLLLIPEMDPAEWLPFAEKGIQPVLLGAFAPASWLSEYVLIGFLLPFVSNRQRVWKSSMISLAVTTFTMVAVNISCLLLFGDVTDRFVFPFMIATRYISYADFLQHIEALIIAIWITGIFIKISVLHYIHALTVAQWLNLKDYRPLVFPLAFLTVAYSFWVISSQSEIGSLLGSTGNLYTLFSLVFLPGMLLLVASIRNSRASALRR
ncbi:GerAB/ArcD/ProY family transporter [Cohnella boryungensis]|uniref:Endospore germination permease n=1 Tax=Cohnella boryungensis TaxID=768479 RepID=A0ABV8S5Y0_9BACL